MRAVVQRVVSASVVVESAEVSAIESGLLIYLGIERDDTPAAALSLAEKVRFLRIFEDAEGKLNRDVVDAAGQVLVVSAFTVCADARQGRRPSFTAAAAAEQALPLYEFFCDELARLGPVVRRGAFRGYMHVHSVNDGPICILLDTRRNF